MPKPDVSRAQEDPYIQSRYQEWAPSSPPSSIVQNHVTNMLEPRVVINFEEAVNAIDTLMVKRLVERDTVSSQISVYKLAHWDSIIDSDKEEAEKERMFLQLEAILGKDIAYLRETSDRFWDAIMDKSKTIQEEVKVNGDVVDIDILQKRIDTINNDLVRLLRGRIGVFLSQSSIPWSWLEPLFDKEHSASYGKIFTELDALCMRARWAIIPATFTTWSWE